MAPNISVAVGVLGIIYLLLLAFHRFTQSAKEPQSICNGVPFITPLLSMVALGSSFHRLMRDKYNLLIHTLRIPGTRFYIVNSPSLITSVQNRFRILSFPAIEAGIAAKVFGVTEVTNKVFRHNLTSDEGYLMSFPKYVHSALGAGPGRDAMNRRAVQVVASSLNTLAGTENGFRTVHMFQWIRHELLIATTEGVYGPKNPFRDPTMERAWYTFEPGMMMFVLNLFPRLLARKSFQAREYMAQVWQQYFDNEWYKQGSDLVKARVKINEDFEIPMSDTARLEVAGTQAILTNTIPCTFWVVLHIFSDPVVLEEIRQELYQGVRTNDSGRSSLSIINF
ncbi:hypothetical protein F4808DRAFT_465278 [Astrocystis sublimbata]|nr:hypothetical protein F4808DRAFT_465278 [Astrocystis sublimbata]